MSLGLVFCLSIAFAVVPPILYAFLIWWLDWYEREAPRLVIISLIWGAVVAIGVGALAEFVLGLPLQVLFNEKAADFLIVTFAAPVIEELVKGLLLLLILHEVEFDNLTDGIVYGAVIGLGFSLTENVAYFFGAYEEGGALAWLSNILFRSGFCCALHATATAITGAAIGIAKFSRRRSRLGIMALGFTGAIAVHMGWNGFLSLSDLFESGLLAAASIFALPFVVAIVAVLFAWSLRRERRIITTELAAESATGWLPTAHVAILPNLSQRLRPGWLATGIDQSRYVRVCTELAFRRHQIRYVGKRRQAYYEQLVTQLRGEAQRLLGIAMTPSAPSASAVPAPPPPSPPPASPRPD